MPDLETLHNRARALRRSAESLLGDARQLEHDARYCEPQGALDDAAILDRARMLLIAAGYLGAASQAQGLLTSIRAERLQEEMAKPKAGVVNA